VKPCSENSIWVDEDIKLEEKREHEVFHGATLHKMPTLTSDLEDLERSASANKSLIILGLVVTVAMVSATSTKSPYYPISRYCPNSS